MIWMKAPGFQLLRKTGIPGRPEPAFHPQQDARSSHAAWTLLPGPPPPPPSPSHSLSSEFLTWMYPALPWVLYLSTFSTDATGGWGGGEWPSRKWALPPTLLHNSTSACGWEHIFEGTVVLPRIACHVYVAIFGICGHSSAKRAPGWAFKSSVTVNRLKGKFTSLQQQVESTTKRKTRKANIHPNISPFPPTLPM